MKKILMFAVVACVACLSADYYDPYQNQGFYQQGGYPGGGGCPGGCCPGGGCPTGACPSCPTGGCPSCPTGGCPSCPSGGCPSGGYQGGNFYPGGDYQGGGYPGGGGCPGGNCPAQGNYYQQPGRQYPQPTGDQSGGYQQQDNGNPQQQASDRAQFDRDLEKKIRDNLKGGWFTQGYEQISVRSHDGVVTLRGFVLNWDDKNALEEKVRNLEGVRNVNSQIFVRPGNPQEQKK